jgi:hypothetical protein
MQSGLGHRVVWYMVMNVLEEHSGSVSTRLHSPITWKTVILNLNTSNINLILTLVV